MPEDSGELSHKVQIEAAETMLIGTIFEMLIEKGVLHQGETIARLEKVSKEMMAWPNSIKAVCYVDLVRDHIAGEKKGKPS
jgi:UDP-2,3-diacylglucosamine pyrophosphatase LpxH